MGGSTVRYVGRKRLWLLATGLGALAILASTTAPVGAASQGPPCPGNPPSAGFPCIGTFTYDPAVSALALGLPPRNQVLDAGLRRIVAFGRYSQLFQLDISASSGLPVELPRREIGFPLETAAVDGARHRVFAGEARCLQVCPGQRFRIADVSLTGAFATSVFQFPDTTDQRFNGQSVEALGYDAPRTTLYALTSLDSLPANVFPVGTRTTVSAFDASAQDGSLALKWSYPIDMCGAVANQGANPFLGVTPDGTALYFACRGTARLLVPLVLTGPLQSLTFQGVMVVNLGAGDPSGFTTQQYPVDGYLTGLSVAGGDATRQRLAVTIGTDTGRRFLVFDVAQRAWVGSIDLSHSYQTGVAVDPGSGRFYVFVEGPKVYLIDVGPHYIRRAQTANRGVYQYTFANPVVDPGTRRLYITDHPLFDFDFDIRVHQDQTSLP